MIIGDNNTDVRVIGAETTDARIDAENMGIITQVLTSNLYSKPHESFIREIVSNAYDSEREAGTLDMPIIIKVGYKGNGDRSDVTIRDYGKGMSRDEFERVFCSIGASTRRDSNEMIGAFGIGRFSAFAVTDTVYVSAFKDGEVNRYVIGKSGNKIKFILYETAETEEKNGLEYKVLNIKDIQGQMRNALMGVALFPNVYVQGMRMDDIFNKRQIRHHKHYVACDQMKIQHRFAIGNVLYEIDKSQLDDRARVFLTETTTSAFAVKIPIGAVCLTPNREAVIYTSETKAILNKACHDAEDEIHGEIREVVEKSDNIIDYLRVMRGNGIYDTFTGELNGMGFMPHVGIKPDDTYVYKGRSYKGRMNFLETIMDCTLPGCVGCKKEGKIIKDMWHCRIKKLDGNRDSNRKILLVKGTERMSGDLRKYILSHDLDNGRNCLMLSYLIAFDMDREAFRESMWRQIEENLIYRLKGRNSIACDADNMFIIDELYDFIHANATILDVSGNAFQAFKKAQKGTGSDDLMFQVEHVTARIDSVTGLCVVSRDRERYSGMTAVGNVRRMLTKQRGHFVINPPKGTDTILAQRGIGIYRMRKDVASLFMDIPQYDITKDRGASRLRTIYDIFSKEESLKKDVVRHAVLLSAHKLAFEKVLDDYLRVRPMDEYLASIKDAPVDSEAKSIAEELVRRTHVVQAFKKMFSESNDDSDSWLSGDLAENMLVAYIVKTKAFVVDNLKYEKYRKNNLLRVLQGKNPNIHKYQPTKTKQS